MISTLPDVKSIETEVGGITGTRASMNKLPSLMS